MVRRDSAFLVACAALLAGVLTTLAAIKGYSYATWAGMPLVAVFGLRLFALLRLTSLLPRVAVGLLLTPALLSIGAVTIADAAGFGHGDDNASERSCRDTANYAALAALPPGLVVGNIEVGPFLLALTPHTVLAAPYHRTSGIATAHAIFAAPPDVAHRMLRERKVAYVMVCGSRGPYGLTERERTAQPVGATQPRRGSSLAGAGRSARAADRGLPRAAVIERPHVRRKRIRPQSTHLAAGAIDPAARPGRDGELLAGRQRCRRGRLCARARLHQRLGRAAGRRLRTDFGILIDLQRLPRRHLRGIRRAAADPRLELPAVHVCSLFWPLAQLPYFVALAVWTFGLFAIFAASDAVADRAIGAAAAAACCSLLAPATLINGAGGQNGFLTACLLVGGILLLDRRPRARRHPVRAPDLQAASRPGRAVRAAGARAPGGPLRPRP